jgi:hypothetical protein
MGTVLLLLALVKPVGVPEPIRVLLAQHPELHLLTISDVADMVDPGTKSLSAFAIGDATGDGNQDLIAVLVGEQGTAKVWNVVAFNGTAAGFGPLQWILKDHKHPVGGVTIDRRRRKVTVWECFECDFSPWFRWNGESFEEGLWAQGDVLEVAPGGPAQVFPGPDAGTAPTAQVPVYTQVRVLRAGPKLDDRRWYRVRVRVGPRTVEGFVDGRLLWENHGG